MRQTPLAWRESTTVVSLGLAAEILVDGRAVVRLPGHETPILVVRTRKGIFAVENRCPHAGYSLADGVAQRTRIRCARHGRTFDMASGQCRSGFQLRPLVTFQAWLDREGHVMVALPTGSP